jgi:hypothetical protein
MARMQAALVRHLGCGAVVVALALGCGTSDRVAFETADAGDQKPTDLVQLVTLSVDPPSYVAIIDTATDPPTAATVDYHALAGSQDVTSQAKFAVIDETLGSFNGATFTSASKLPDGVLGKTTQVTASLDTYVTGLANLSVVQLRKSGPQRDFFFIVPFGKEPTPTSDVLQFDPKIRQVDVAFSMDTTASMSGSIRNLTTALKGSMFGDLKNAIPDVGLAVVDFKDFPFGGYGGTGDFPVKVWQKVTTNLSAAKSAVQKYDASGGGDGPEAQIPAMFHILTGQKVSWPTGSVAAVEPTPGHWGAVDFRPGAVPVVVNITDIDWHGAGHTPYSFAAPDLPTLGAAFASNNAFFVDITSGDESQANKLSDATNSNVDPSAFGTMCDPGMCCTGLYGASRAPDAPGGRCRLNFMHTGGDGVSDGVVTAITAIAAGAQFDVRAAISNDETNPGGVDATQFIESLRAMDEGSDTCPPASVDDSDGDGINDTFLGVSVGTPICFEITVKTNTIVPETDEAQFFKAFIDVVGVAGNVQLDRREVLFLVPPRAAVTQ